MPEVKIKLAESLRERLYFDEDTITLYVSSLDLYKMGEFVTYLGEFKKSLWTSESVSDVNLEMRGSDLCIVYFREEGLLKKEER